MILGRRGAGDVAFSVGDLLALGAMPGVDVSVAGDLGARPDDSFERTLKYDLLREFVARPAVPGNRRIVFQFSTQPMAFVGTDRVEGLVVAPAFMSPAGSSGGPAV